MTNDEDEMGGLKREFAVGSLVEGLDFADLRLKRHMNGDIEFDRDVLIAFCEGNDFDPDPIFEFEDNIAALISGWYRAHRRCGGAPDPVQEQLIQEAEFEDQHGGGFSHQPGQA